MSEPTPLEAARTLPEILGALWMGLDGEGEPPSPETLGEWLRKCPDTATDEVGRRLAQMFPAPPGELPELYAGTLWRWRWRKRTAQLIAPVPTERVGAPEADLAPTEPPPTTTPPATLPPPATVPPVTPEANPEPGLRWLDAVTINTIWAAAETRPRHPLAPTVRAWRDRIVTEPNRNERGIMPGALGAGMVAPAIAPEGRLPEMLDPAPLGPGEIQLDLRLSDYAPLRVPDVPHLDVWPTEAQRGGGAPMAQGFWFDALSQLPQEARTELAAGKAITLGMTLGDWIAATGMQHYRPSRHFAALRHALWKMDGFRVVWKRREWRLTELHALPTRDTKRSDKVPIRIKLPEGMAGGASIDRPRLREYRPASAVQWRAWIRLAYLWDRYGTSKGRRIYATRPVVLRDKHGCPVNAKGEPIRMRAGKPAHWSHPATVEMGTFERNPEADRIPALTPRELIALGFDAAEVVGAQFRDRLRIVRRELREMADGFDRRGECATCIGTRDGGFNPKGKRRPPGHIGECRGSPAIVIEEVGDAWRILEPRPAEVSTG